MKPKTSMGNELLSLLQSTKEHFKSLDEMGVEGIEGGSLKTRTIEFYKATGVSSPVGNTTRVMPRVRIEEVSSSGSVQASHNLFAELAPSVVKPSPSGESLDQVQGELSSCNRCPLHKGRTNIVHTEGNRNARLMFVGEAPGADEDEQARPFVGRAGQLLTKIIEAIGFTRDDVLIGNVNRCRPPGNRAPTPDEVSMCKPFLLREIAAVQPDVIVVMGNTAMKNLLGTKEGITRIRGQFQEYKGIKVMPTFHPAYLLRDPSKKRETWDDMKKVRDYLDRSGENP